MTMRVYQKAWGVASDIRFPLFKPTSATDFATGLTILSGECQISQDGASFVNTTNLPAEIGSSGIYSLTLTVAETQCSDAVIKVIDTPSKAWIDQSFLLDISGYRTSADQCQIGEVDTAAFTATSTEFECDLLLGTEHTTADAYKDRQIIFVDDGTVCQIEASEAGSVDGLKFTTTIIPTGAPANAARFVIL